MICLLLSSRELPIKILSLAMVQENSLILLIVLTGSCTSSCVVELNTLFGVKRSKDMAIGTGYLPSNYFLAELSIFASLKACESI